jgi:hypothetical protein
MAALAAVYDTLEQWLQRNQFQQEGKPIMSDAGASTRSEDEADSSVPAKLEESTEGPPFALDLVCTAFGLSPFERDVLLLCAGPELDTKFRALVAAAQGDGRRTSPTFSLALAALPAAHWSALAPSAPLRYWRLIELGSSDMVTAAPLRIDERILHFLAGVDYLADRLQPVAQRVEPEPELPPSHFALARRIVDAWSREVPDHLRRIIVLCGDDAQGKRAVAAAACAEVGLQVHMICAADIPALAAERQSLARLWEREAILSRSALLVEADGADDTEQTRSLIPFLETVQGFLLISRRDPLLPLSKRTPIRFEVNKPSAREQQDLWVNALGPIALHLNGEVDRVLAQFNLSAAAIRATCAEVRQRAAGRDGSSLEGGLWELCRAQTRPRLDDLAQRLRPVAGWDDLVLPEEQRRVLREIAAQVRQRFKVYEAWGFSSKCNRGLGISALFTGASGTGKTMAAEVLARELALDLYRIDLSAVVSKYIGETEKNLRRIFDAAEDGGVLLLFDEADAIFGKRSEVKDSHDRYANIEVSYLLQRTEAYRGLAILTTNMKDALDAAFLRRIRFVVQFPFPDSAQRAEIWRRIFPAASLTEGLDAKKMALLNVPGGSIRNIALNAAFLAAEDEQPVRMSHVLRATRTEYSKLEKPLTDSEIKGWL